MNFYVTANIGCFKKQIHKDLKKQKQAAKHFKSVVE